MARTRGAKNAPKAGAVKTIAEATAAASGTTPKVSLQPESTNPPKLFILPTDTSPEARIALLENPKTSELSRYLCCPKKGFYEFTKVGPPKTTPRSWLIAPSGSEENENSKNAKLDEKADGSDFKSGEGYVTKSSDLFIATPVDPLFLILPALAPAPSTKASASEDKKLFLASDDYLDVMMTNSPEVRSLLRLESIRQRLEMRMSSVCDIVEAGDETMYRLNEGKLLEEIMGKAKKMVDKGLPASMEDKFVRRALEAPVLTMSLQHEESSTSTDSEGNIENIPPGSMTDAKLESQTTTPESKYSQSSTTSSTTISTESSTTTISTATYFTESLIPTQTTPPENVPELLRLKTAFSFLLSSYLPPHLSTLLKNLLASSSTYPFAPLENHLKNLADLRRKALEARALTNDYSRKRGGGFEEEYMNETRAEKKRKIEEEEKRKKAGESRGVRDLKKVDVSGMKKMSDFFKKKAK